MDQSFYASLHSKLQQVVGRPPSPRNTIASPITTTTTSTPASSNKVQVGSNNSNLLLPNSFDPLLEDVSISPPSTVADPGEVNSYRSGSRSGDFILGLQQINTSKSSVDKSARSFNVSRSGNNSSSCNNVNNVDTSSKFLNDKILVSMDVVNIVSGNSSEASSSAVDYKSITGDGSRGDNLSSGKQRSTDGDKNQKKGLMVVDHQQSSDVINSSTSRSGVTRRLTDMAVASRSNSQVVTANLITPTKEEEEGRAHDYDDDDESTFEISLVGEEMMIIKKPAAAAAVTANKDGNGDDSNNQVAADEKTRSNKSPPSKTESIVKSSKPSSSPSSNSNKNNPPPSNSDHIQPLLINTPPNTPLLIDIDMIMPLVSYVQPSSPLRGIVEIGDILVFIDGKSTAELSHGVLTKMLNGGGGSSGSGSNKGGGKKEEGHKLVMLKGKYSKKLGIISDASGSRTRSTRKIDTLDANKAIAANKEDGQTVTNNEDVSSSSHGKQIDRSSSKGSSSQGGSSSSVPMTEAESEAPPVKGAKASISQERQNSNGGSSSKSPGKNDGSSRSEGTDGVPATKSASSSQPSILSVHRSNNTQSSSPSSSSFEHQQPVACAVSDMLMKQPTNKSSSSGANDEHEHDTKSSPSCKVGDIEMMISPTTTDTTLDDSDGSSSSSSNNEHEDHNNNIPLLDAGINAKSEQAKARARMNHSTTLPSSQDVVIAHSSEVPVERNVISPTSFVTCKSHQSFQSRQSSGSISKHSHQSNSRPKKDALLQLAESGHSSAPESIVGVSGQNNVNVHNVVNRTSSASSSHAESVNNSPSITTADRIIQHLHKVCQTHVHHHDDDDVAVGQQGGQKVDDGPPSSSSVNVSQRKMEIERKYNARMNKKLQSESGTPINSINVSEQNTSTGIMEKEVGQQQQPLPGEHQVQPEKQKASSSSCSSDPMTEQPSISQEQKEMDRQLQKKVAKKAAEDKKGVDQKNTSNASQKGSTNKSAKQGSSRPITESNVPEVDDDVMDEDDKRRLERRNRAPPKFDHVTTSETIDEISTIYGGQWNPTFQSSAAQRMEDRLGYMEEGYLGNTYGGDGSTVHNCGSTCASPNTNNQHRMYDPNTHSQLQILGLESSNNKSGRHHEHNDAMMRRTDLELQEKENEEEVEKRRLRKQQVCVEGVLVTLIVLSVVALVVILVLVLRK